MVAVVQGFPSDIRRVGEDRQVFERRAPHLIALARQAAGGQALNVLALSGGGAGGAFGAGALVGWSRRGTRPDFQIVTGVSAGALIAPLAFLGQDWDPQLAEAFSGSQTEHLMHRRLLGGLLGASVYDGKPLAKLVDHYVTDELLRAVAQRSREGRLLLVATTNLDSEEPVIWNLGLIAEQGGPVARRLFRDVLIASSSVPGIFPPVMISVQQGGRSFQEMHVDGSAINSLFFIPDVAAILPNPIESLHGGHLYVLVN
ncbi:MAG: patatin-like phospholipase family protein, partial [Steroidobacteraceae bacterium]